MAPAGGVVSVRHGTSSAVPGGSDDNLAAEESCPVCKTSRYFNKDIEFLINPECYHRMCRTCMERIFRDGPNQCPHAGCHKTLRKRGFKSAFFSDLRVEREVDIRRRVANVFNKVEDDFETLDDYNDYLYKVECLTDDLVNGKEEAKRRAETELVEWEAQHKAEIDRNKKLARESDEARQKRIAMEREAARQRRLDDFQAEAEEKANAARFREEMLDSLQTAEEGQAAQAMNKIILKRRGQQKRDSVMDTMASSTGSLSIRGLRDRAAEAAAEAEEEGPYDPYGGLDMRPQRIDLAPEKLADYGQGNEWIESARHKDEFKVGGYSPDEYISRALYEAFAGLGVFIGEEKIDRGVGTMGAAEAAQTGVTAGSMDVDDPY
ncbi:hypothetical protein NLU13_1223 [Sarocladium strictum]|uniref:RNA polymerase II transcription factor B subunit 3 n=1 Tax=Sarocladium strictum TaxID=5046 RepID=A0AA39GRA5_SARSR|nr:hypothetical protein NLU13_1223 [Sarocladium strictum]